MDTLEDDNVGIAIDELESSTGGPKIRARLRPEYIAKLPPNSVYTRAISPHCKDYKILYNAKPKTILICQSPFNPAARAAAMELEEFITNSLNVNVVMDQTPLAKETNFKLYAVDLARQRTEGPDYSSVDLVISIGGDGTILNVCRLFSRSVPPVIGLSMGSLGYMAKFKMDDVKNILQKINTKGFNISLRSRLIIKLLDENEHVVRKFTALNECVVDRGISPYITTLDVYYDGNYLTTVSGDGLLVATPSGSTAYSMSAGGPIVHPNVRSMLFTVICPHSISYRPLVLPADSQIEIAVPQDNRGDVRLCVDGYNCGMLRHGESVRIACAEHAFPLVLPDDAETITEWCKSLREHLHWNFRIRQKRLYTREEAPDDFDDIDTDVTKLDTVNN